MLTYKVKLYNYGSISNWKYDSTKVHESEISKMLFTQSRDSNILCYLLVNNYIITIEFPFQIIII